MSNSLDRSTGIKDDGAEGFSRSNYPREAKTTSRTGLAPAVRLSSNRGTPSTETGLAEMVHLDHEGKDNTDAQDAPRKKAEMTPESGTQGNASRSQQPSVLIIEDSTELAEIIEATLQRLDMTTAHETHGNKGYNRWDEMQPDVLLLDIGLPDMTGWKLLEDMREREGDANMPKVVIITAYGDPANRLIGKLQNVHDYLIKPFTAEEVERVVLGALGKAVR
jgi:CheY-like chemotaxis protein